MRHDAQVINRIKEVQSFPSLLKFLRDDLDWPITSNDVEDLTFDYSPDELGFDKKMAVKVRSIKQLRPLVKDQPWGIFYIDFEPKRLPVGALRRLLRSLVVKKRGGGDGSQATWNLDDLLFISFHGEESRRTVAFAHFHERDKKQPQLRTFYWDQGETEFASVLESLGKLNWPQYASSAEMAHVWRQYWGAAFRVGHGEVIRDSKALSKKLAQVALKIRQHVFDLLDAEDADKGPLHRLFASFKKALLHDLDEQRFADVLAQTFTYGLLAAKAEIGTKTPLEPGHLAEQIPATNPLLRELFEEFQHLTGVGLDKLDEDLGDLGVDELVDLLNTVDVDEALKNFGRTTMSGQEDPVVHFYEEFLKDYDKEQKVERGVFYTPKPVVSFIVRSVHEILQKEFGLEDGLASTATWHDMVAKHAGLAKPEGIRGDEPFVQILDPAVGTGTFLEACIQLIYDTMAAKWSRAGKDVKAEWNRYVPEHLLPRLHGFELMMAPYVVCHMKLGLRLKELGYDFQSGERLRVYLTNALEPGQEDQTSFVTMVAAVAHEAFAANIDKLRKKFTCLLGNPPYSGHSYNDSKDEHGNPTYIGRLLRDYYVVDGNPLGERNPKWLQDDYVKFFRLAEHAVRKSNIGLVGMVTNHGFLDNPTFRGMRQHFMRTFSSLKFLDLHGNSKKVEAIPEASGNDNVFDIQQGVAVTLALRMMPRPETTIALADLWGTRGEKYEFLVRNTVWTTSLVDVTPQVSPYMFIHVGDTDIGEYEQFLPISQLMPTNSVGIVTSRDNLVLGFSEEEVRAKQADFLDLNIPDDVIREHYFAGRRMGQKAREKGLPGDSSGWKLSEVRRLLAAKPELHGQIIPIVYRPFDIRYLWFSESLIERSRKKVMNEMTSGRNLGLMVSRSTKGAPFHDAFVVMHPTEFGSMAMRISNSAPLAPLLVGFTEKEEGSSLFGESLGPRGYINLQEVGFKDLVRSSGEPAPSNPMSIAEALPFLGYIYAILSSPAYRERYSEPLMRDFARVPCRSPQALFKALWPLGADLIHLHTLDETRTKQASVRRVGEFRTLVESPTYGQSVVRVGKGNSGFENVSKAVWSFFVGGYQPAQRWLKERTGRRLTEAEIRHYEKMLFAIEETIRIMAEIDEVIEAHGGWPGAFQGGVDVD
mgnify:CR=1 FL=1